MVNSKVSESTFMEQALAGHLLCPGFKEMNKADRKCLSLCSPCSREEMTGRTHAVGSGGNKCYEKKLSREGSSRDVLGMGGSTIINRAVREGHTEKVNI